MFPRNQRLTRPKDVQRVYKRGQSAGTRSLFIRALPNNRQTPRSTVIIAKKVVKKAVERNRLKRLVRQSLQELMTDQAFTGKLMGKDLIITIHRRPEEPFSLAPIKSEVVQCFDRLP